MKKLETQANESEQSQTFAEKKNESNNQSGEQIVKRLEIEGTPFVLIEIPENNECFLTMGKHRVTEKYEITEANLSMLIELVEIRDYSLLMTMMAIITENVILEIERKKFPDTWKGQVNVEQKMKDMMQESNKRNAEWVKEQANNHGVQL